MKTPYDTAQRFVGVAEAPGAPSNPLVLAFLKLDNQWPADDSVPWCSAFINFVAWLWRLPRSKSLAARSWLLVGEPVALEAARPGYDVAIFTRAGATKDPTVISAPGHVGFFAGVEGADVLVLGGNQSDRVSLARYPVKNLLGVRRLT